MAPEGFSHLYNENKVAGRNSPIRWLELSVILKAVNGGSSLKGIILSIAFLATHKEYRG